MHEHGEVADLLRHGMGDDRDRRRDPQCRAGQKGRGDDHAVAEIVHAGTDEDHEAGTTLVRPVRMQRMLVLRLFGVVLVRGVAVRVAPENELFQREEREEAHEHRGHYPLGIARLERVRQELEEHGAKQRADGERHDAGDPRSMQHQRPGGRGRREHAARKRGGDDLHEDGQGGGSAGSPTGPWVARGRAHRRWHPALYASRMALRPSIRARAQRRTCSEFAVPREPHDGGHPARVALATIREKARGIGMRAIAAAPHLRHSAAHEARSREPIEIGVPFARAMRREADLVPRDRPRRTARAHRRRLRSGRDRSRGRARRRGRPLSRRDRRAPRSSLRVRPRRVRASPPWAMPTALPPRSAKSTGRQSAVRTAQTTPRSRVTAASAMGLGKLDDAAVSVTTAAPCT